MKLVFLHGRGQEDKDPHVLRQTWIASLHAGLHKAGLELPIDDSEIIFPYYGDALRDLTTEDAETLSLVRFPQREHDLACEVLGECLERSLPDAIVAPNDKSEETLGARLRGPLRAEWVQRGLRLLDRHVPQASARSMALTAYDVVEYLTNADVQHSIEAGVAQAFDTSDPEPAVVVGHSLGSVVAYRVLRDGGWVTHPVKALLTLGSPLGISAVRSQLEPLEYPPKVGSWLNAYDERDAIALNPLNSMYFPMTPEIKNYGGVENDSDNHHKIRGYLSDRVVATWIVKALRA